MFPVGTPDWHCEQVRRFSEVRRDFEKAAEILEKVLKEIARRSAPTAIVQARAKSLASVSEKILRKQDKYANPVEQLTDLVGGRIITYTQADRAAVCRLIESLDAENPWIDWDNSEDTSQRLGLAEFGYQAMHYIVQLRPPRMLGHEMGSWVEKYKMEIQVCTMMQHVWSTVGHDRVYKTSLTVPDELKRRLGVASAMIEAAQTEFDSAVAALDHYIRTFPPHVEQKKLEQEELKWTSVIAVEPRDEDARRKLADFYIQTEKWKEAYGQLSKCDVSLPGVLRLKGLAALHMGKHDTAERLLAKAVKLDEADWSAWCHLAQVRRRGNAKRAPVAEYTAAFRAAPHEPRALVGYVSSLVAKEADAGCTKALHGALQVAIDECRRRVELGVDLPAAYFQMGRCHLLNGRCYDAMDAYCRASGACTSVQPIEAELRDLQLIEKGLSSGGNEARDAVSCARRLLQLLAICFPHRQVAARWTSAEQATLSQLATAQKRPRFEKRPVVIVAGGCDRRLARLIRGYQELIRKAFAHFRGTIICGGTTAGISGAIARVASERKAAIDAIGYLPSSVPRPDKISKAYRICKVRANGYSPIGVIQTWADLLLAGVNPTEVRVLGINGGDLSGFEYRLALAMGARVGIIESSGRSADGMLQDAGWSKHPRLLPLPNDPMTAQAFVSVGQSDLSQEELERMGRIAHDVYREGQAPDYRSPSTLPWECIPEDFRKSSRDQAAYAFEMLRGWGFRARKVDGNLRPIPIPKRFVERMAEQEHGRWNFERLLSGWRRGPKDIEKKLSPYLRPWTALPEAVKEYDRKAIRQAFPRILAAGGYELISPSP